MRALGGTVLRIPRPDTREALRAKVVAMSFSMTYEQIAGRLGISRSTVIRYSSKP